MNQPQHNVITANITSQQSPLFPLGAEEQRASFKVALRAE
jgi:hypothetical protein